VLEEVGVVTGGDEVDEEEVGVLEVEDDEEVGVETGQAPVMDGTALGPLEIATRFVPQSAAWATCRFWLSWS
jgi:hypothetical protein